MYVHLFVDRSGCFVQAVEYANWVIVDVNSSNIYIYMHMYNYTDVRLRNCSESHIYIYIHNYVQNIYFIYIYIQMHIYSRFNKCFNVYRCSWVARLE